MIAAPLIGVLPSPELPLAPRPKADAVSFGFASIMQTVAPPAQATAVKPDLQVLVPLPLAEIDVSVTVQPAGDSSHPVVKTDKTPLPAPIVGADASKIAYAVLLVQGGGSPVVLAAIDERANLVANEPETAPDKTKTSSDDHSLDLDEFISALGGRPTFLEHQTVEALVAVSSPEKQTSPPQTALPSPERTVSPDALGLKLPVQIDRVEMSFTALPELRGPTATANSIMDKSQPSLVERGTAFAPMLVQVARDVMALSTDGDVHFNLRPDILGPVAVTIERTDAGPNLRLGVETHAAVQAVRAAEPMLNDGRSATPFVQVSVDMNAPDQRSRNSYRPVVAPRRGDVRATDIIIERGPLAAGRYA